MSLTLGDNFSYQGAKPLDARLKYETVAAMKAVADATMYDGCLAYCAGTDKTYQWKSGNTVDETTGKWREFNSGGGGGGGETYTAGDGIDISAENEISTEKSEAGWMDEVIEKVPMSGSLVNIANAFNRSDLYSTTERVVGQWIDGKPIYQKTINAGSYTNAGSTVEIDVGANIDHITKVDFFGESASGGFWPVPYVDWQTMNNQIELWGSGVGSISGHRYIKFRSKVTYSNTTFYVTVQYTKTTDSAIAIGSETEYSTTEKIVGSWIDGSPIYQKTVNIGSLPNSGTKEIAHGITSLDKVISSCGIAVNSSYNLTIPRISSNSAYNIYLLAVTATDIQVNAPFNASDYTGYITLQYTKLT